VNGILLFDKPRGWTSHNAVSFVRRKTGQKKVGHAGTLDPLATGLLVLLVGQATKWSDELMGHDKEYTGFFRLGMITDTYDLEGKVLSESVFSHITQQAVEDSFSVFRGEIEQAAPIFSAIKKQGRKLYELARAGVAVEAPLRRITIHELRMTEFHLPEVGFYLKCSKGTYVRSLANDIGRRLDCGAALSALRRMSSGSFHVDNAWTKDAFASAPVSEIEKTLIQK
jgi:tRNA pseudouridine55 synthase